MIGIKVVAIALTGLGSVVMGSNVHRSTVERAALHAGWRESALVSSPPAEAEPRAGPDVIFPEAPRNDCILMKEVIIRPSKAPSTRSP